MGRVLFMTLKAIILAAGKGSRMKSDTLKVLHDVAGKAVLEHVVDTVLSSHVNEIFVVVGHQADLVKKRIQNPKIKFVHQEEQLGTGHAVMQVAPYLDSNEDETLVILAGDCPLIELATLQNLLNIHLESNAEASILSTEMQDPGSYGRILRGKMGTVIGIKEAKDCTEEELKITEINTGIYAFQKRALCDALKLITTDNNQHEYYLTDAIHILKEKGSVVEAYCAEDSDQAIGINTRMDLAKINQIIYQKNNSRLMQDGVTIIDPASTFIDSTVSVGQDTIIHPFTTLTGKTTIETGGKIGPYTYIKDSFLSVGSVVEPFSKLINHHV